MTLVVGNQRQKLVGWLFWKDRSFAFMDKLTNQISLESPGCPLWMTTGFILADSYVFLNKALKVMSRTEDKNALLGLTDQKNPTIISVLR